MNCKDCDKHILRIRQLEELIFQYRLKENETKIINERLIDNQPLDLSDERIIYLLETYYTYELFLKGTDGLIYFICSYILRNDNDVLVYRCIDKHKKIFHYYDGNGICIDTKCKVLLEHFRNPFVKRLNCIYKKALEEIYKSPNTLTSLYSNCEESITQRCSSETEEQSDNEDSENYDSDIEELLASELLEDKIDDNINTVVSLFLELKNYYKTKKNLIDELTKIL